MNRMNAMNNLKLAVISMLLLGGLAACDQPGPAESAGKKLDQTVDLARDKISEAADKVSEGANKTADQVSEGADKAADKLGEQGDKVGVGINDVEITTRVKAAIFAEPGLKTLQISVDTIKGVVTLSGSVDTQHNSDTARALASAVDGVRGVVNNLMIKPAQ